MSLTSFFTGDSGSETGGQTTFGSIVTDVGTLFQAGYGAYQQVSSGAPARNPVPGATSGSSSSSSSAPTRILGFTVAEVIIAVLILIALGIGIYFVAK